MTTATLHPERGRNSPGGKIRVLVVDDSVVIRHLLRQALGEDPDLEVVGAEANGIDALARIPLVKPDLVTLDIEMPQMDGLQTLREIRKSYPRLRTIMFSTLTTRGGGATFEALSLGADDYVAKSGNAGVLEQSLASLRAELIPKIKQFFVTSALRPARAPSPAAPPPKRTSVANARIVAIGISTGGPQALAALVPRLPADFPLPILIVQHMPATFTRMLAERLNSPGGLRVEEAADAMEILPGRILIAPGDHHLRVRNAGVSCRTVLDQGPHENSCRPSVDVLFRSLSETYRGDVLSVVMTGMGSDGLRGTKALKALGAYSLVQDEASSVVWGMPGAVAQAGLADNIVPLEKIAAELVRLTGV
jgi:two-component system, chemotaxis family, protein-glutamate methylesterase/glutaminase